MPKNTIHRLGDLQLRILQVLWERGEANVAEVNKALSTGGRAYTTIATMLKKMEARGLVKHRLEDRKFLYQAKVKEEEVARNLSSHLVERLFEGSVTDLVAQLLSAREVSRAELAELEKLIAEKKKSL